MTTPSPTLDQKLFFTHLPFWPEVRHLVDVGSGPLAEVSVAAQAMRPELKVTYLDEAMRLTWKEFLSFGGRVPPNTALLFSSVLHEMFSEAGHYGGFEPKSFWADVATVSPEYVIVRDMAWNTLPEFPTACPHPEIARGIRAAIAAESPSGTYRVLFDLTLSQLHPPADWDKEMAEDYFALESRPFVLEASRHGYTVLHSRQFTPPWIAEWLVTDRGVEPALVKACTTHVEYVFARRR